MKYFIPLFLTLLCCLPQLRAEISVSLADSVTCVCEGNPQQAFAVIATGSAGPFTFEWAGSEGYSSTAMMPADIEIAGTYTLMVTNAYECTFAYQVEAPACGGPTFQFDIDQPSDCGQDDGFIDLTLSGGTPPFTYQWYINGSPSVTSEDLEDAEEGPVYSVEATDANGCTFSAEAPEVEQLAPLSLQLVSINNSCATPANGSITVAAEGGAPPYSYTWSTGDVTSTGTLSGLSPGTYQVTVADEDGCTDTASAHVMAGDGPGDLLFPVSDASCQNTTHYPNPFHHHLNLQIEAETAGKLQAKLYNALGRAVVSTTFEISRGQQALTLGGLSDLPPGLYWLQLSLPGQPARLYKAVKQ